MEMHDLQARLHELIELHGPAHARFELHHYVPAMVHENRVWFDKNMTPKKLVKRLGRDKAYRDQVFARIYLYGSSMMPPVRLDQLRPDLLARLSDIVHTWPDAASLSEAADRGAIGPRNDRDSLPEHIASLQDNSERRIALKVSFEKTSREAAAQAQIARSSGLSAAIWIGHLSTLNMEYAPQMFTLVLGRTDQDIQDHWRALSLVRSGAPLYSAGHLLMGHELGYSMDDLATFVTKRGTQVEAAHERLSALRSMCHQLEPAPVLRPLTDRTQAAVPASDISHEL